MKNKKLALIALLALCTTGVFAETQKTLNGFPEEVNDPLYLKWSRIEISGELPGYPEMRAALPKNINWIEYDQNIRKPDQALYFTEVVCGDAQRFHVDLKLPEKPTLPVSDCTAVAGLSPDKKRIVIESAVIDVQTWTQRSFPASIPETGYVLAWSKDGKKVALAGAGEVIILEFLEDKPEIPWRGVVSFMSGDRVTTEDWDWYNSDIYNACKGEGLYFKFDSANEEFVLIGPNEKKINLKNIRKEHTKGWALIKNGEVTEVLMYNPMNRSKAVAFCENESE